MDQGNVAEIVREYAKRACQTMRVKKVILFGSYARGTASTDSDIDVAVVVERVQGDFLSEASKLFKIRHGLDERIEPVLLEDVDDPSGFYDEINRTGKVCYQAG